MSFQVPRRDHFPRPVGDNSPFTPPDPEPQWPPYKPPNAEDYRLARQRWEQTGELAALWEMLDNVGARPWPPPKPSPAVMMMQAAEQVTWTRATLEAIQAEARRPRLILMIIPALIAIVLVFDLLLAFR